MSLCIIFKGIFYCILARTCGSRLKNPFDNYISMASSSLGNLTSSAYFLHSGKLFRTTSKIFDLSSAILIVEGSFSTNSLVSLELPTYSISPWVPFSKYGRLLLFSFDRRNPNLNAFPTIRISSTVAAGLP